MLMFTNCSGPCCTCGCGSGCLAGHGDDDYFPISNENLINNYVNGKYKSEDQDKIMIAELKRRGYSEEQIQEFTIKRNNITEESHEWHHEYKEYLRNSNFFR